MKNHLKIDAELPRVDFRALPTCTIDPVDAKDHDDALSVVFLDNGDIQLGVHIADVSHYLPYNSTEDIKAQKKATSVYLVGKVDHMLPSELSEDQCSLVPHKDRFAFSVMFVFDRHYHLKSHTFCKSVICSDAKLSYEDAEHILNTKKGAFSKELLTAYEITKRLREARVAHGAIEFVSDEVKITRDSKGMPVKIEVKETLESMKLIEECMLLANKVVAEYIEKNTRGDKKIGVYRVHDGPQGEKRLFLETMLRELGVTIKASKGKIPQKELQQVMQKASAAEQEFLKLILLRSMGKAYYTTINSGHYGLGLSAYTHFTSPIRRYPDIMVHRILYSLLTNTRLSSSELRTYGKLCNHATEMEIAAQDAERDSVKNMQVLYMSTKIGKKYKGIITGIVPYGIFVREQSTRSEGFIHVRGLSNEFVHHDAKKNILHDSRNTFRLGGEVTVTLESVNAEKGFINYQLA